jgi:predicted chitinase
MGRDGAGPAGAAGSGRHRREAPPAGAGREGHDHRGIASGFDWQAADHGVTTRLRICHFLAQVAHETDKFRTLQEYGSTAYFARYEGRRDLGNTKAGDGARFHGRGVFQLTGRSNYPRYCALLGLDLEANPELAKDPAISPSPIGASAASTPRRMPTTSCT